MVGEVGNVDWIVGRAGVITPCALANGLTGDTAGGAVAGWLGYDGRNAV